MKQVSDKDLFNLWLVPYHGITIEEVIAKYPKEVLETPSWYKLHPVTQEQHDEWVIKAKELIMKTSKISKKIVDASWWHVYLNTSPYIIPNEP
jgi:hypothetical protein